MTTRRGVAQASSRRTTVAAAAKAASKPKPAPAPKPAKAKAAKKAKPKKVKETKFAPLAELKLPPPKPKKEKKPVGDAPDFMNEIEADAQSKITKAPDPAAMNKMTDLAKELAEALSYVERGEEAIKRKKARILEIQTKELVALMDEVGQDHLGLSHDNVDVVVSTAYHASLPALPAPHKDDYQQKFERRQRGLTWLREEGHDGLIKTEVIIEFPRGGVARAAQVAEEMEQRAREHADTHDGEKPYDVEVKEAVNHASLSKLVRELSEEGRTDLPLADLGAHVIRLAEIIPRSERKTTTKKVK